MLLLWSDSQLTCLSKDDMFQLVIGKALAGHIFVPSLIEVRPALQDPEDAQYDIADNQNANGCP